ncbi:hypothetical protein [Streptomyces sp. CA-106131]|uniref:hypothetical protein n=1 Tax=Streptomyces sp. CA-106131 TaxID=3240045 RepID=UPI003D948665
MFDRTPTRPPRDYLAWAALAAALVVTASAEYALARQAGFGQWTAGALPAALDIYAVRALRARRDVAAAVAAMIATNAASHLVAARLLPVAWPLVVAVSAIAPLVVWRVHRLAEHVAHTAPHRAEAAPAEPVPAPVSAVPEAVEDVPEPVVDEAAEDAPSVPTLGDFRPVAWPPAPVPGYALATGQQRSEVTVRWTPDETDEAAGYAVPEPVDEDQADALAEQARTDFAQLLATGRTPSIRRLRDTYSIGQPRAQRVQRALAEAVTA